MSIRDCVVQLAHNGSCDLAGNILSDKQQFGGRDLIMTGVSLEAPNCESCSWLLGRIEAEIKRRGLTWNSY